MIEKYVSHHQTELAGEYFWMFKKNKIKSSRCAPVSITEQMTAIRKRNETSVIGQIGDDLLGWVRLASSICERGLKTETGFICIFSHISPSAQTR